MKRPDPFSLDLNPQFLYALHVMEEIDKNVFITGRAGTGKSTLLQHFRNTTKKKMQSAYFSIFTPLESSLPIRLNIIIICEAPR